MEWRLLNLVIYSAEFLKVPYLDLFSALFTSMVCILYLKKLFLFCMPITNIFISDKEEHKLTDPLS